MYGAKYCKDVESEMGEKIILSANKIPSHTVSAVFETKLRPRFTEFFTVIARKGLAYTITLQEKMRTHPYFALACLSSIGIRSQ